MKGAWDLIVPGTKEETIAYAAEHFIETANAAIKKKGAFYVALSGGSTPNALYEKLKEPKNLSRIQKGAIYLFWSDERAVSQTDKESNYHNAMQSGIGALQIPPSQIFRMEAEKNIQENAKKYEDLIQKIIPKAKFDLVMLGLGVDGHIASLFPETAALRETKSLVSANFIDKLNEWRMTLTKPCINQAEKIILYVMGGSKAKVVKEAWEGAPFPVSQIGKAPHQLLWILDQEAAGEIS